MSDRRITVGDVDGASYSLPIERILTGRGFVTGKSGSGKSSTASVIAEELLDRGHPLLIVDIEGEYWGLKEDYEVLHVGATDEVDLKIGPEHAEKLADLALNQGVPIIVDLSGYIDRDVADEIVREVAKSLFHREQDAQRPFLLLVEEVHEWVPQTGSVGKTGEWLVRIAKRGRKRGLGIAGISQRPSDVDKDLITQADWLVWHRLTWDNDTNVVRDVAGREPANVIDSLADGEAFVQADWSDREVQRVQFREKRTFDAGATPGLEDIERPELQSIDDDLVDELAEITEEHEQREDRIRTLEAELHDRQERISELEERLDRVLDLRRMVESVNGIGPSTPEEISIELGDQELALPEIRAEVLEVREQKKALETKVEELQRERDELRQQLEQKAAREEYADALAELIEWVDRHRETLSDVAEVPFSPGLENHVIDVIEEKDERITELERELAAKQDGWGPDIPHELIHHEEIQAALDVVKEESRCAPERIDQVLRILLTADADSLKSSEIAPLMGVSDTTVREALRDLFSASLVQRTETTSRGYEWWVDEETIKRRIEVAEARST